MPGPINDFLTWVLIVVLVVLGLAFTIVSRFVQFRYFGKMFGILLQAFYHEKRRVGSFRPSSSLR